MCIKGIFYLFELCAIKTSYNIAIINFYMPAKITVMIIGDRHGCDRMVVGFTTTYAIGAYHH